MGYLTPWEKSLLHSLLDRYEAGDFNCGATTDEMVKACCKKADNSGDTYLDLPCGKCEFRKRFLKPKSKL